MSIEIPNDRPLNEAEREHLQIWDPRRLELHDRRFPPQEEETEQPDEVPPYVDWKVKDLLEEIRARGLEMPANKTKNDLAEVLDKHDAEEKIAEEGGE